MAIPFNDNFSINAPKLVDDRTKKSDGSAYTSKADVLANLVLSRRTVGLPVLINTDLYYFKTGVTLQSDLVKLSSGDLPANMVLTLSGDLVDNTDPSNPVIVFTQGDYDISNFTNVSGNPFVRQNALDNKVDKIPGRGLSEANYTNSEKSKLAGIEAGAQVNKLERIYLDGIEVPITSKAVFLSSGGDRIVNVGSILLDENELTLTTVFKWVIGGIFYENLTDWVDIINYTTGALEKRKDIIVANQGGTFQRIQGVESETVPILPITPPDTVLVTTLDVFFDTISDPTPPITDDIYEKKDLYIVNIDSNGVLAVDPILADNVKNINLVAGFTEDIEGFAENNSGNLYPRMPLIIRNSTGTSVNIVHNGSAFYKLFFQDEEDYILEDEEVLLFYYRDNSSNIFDFTSSNKYTEKYIDDKIAEITLEDVRAVDNEVTGNITGTAVFVKTEDEDFLQKKDLDDTLADKADLVSGTVPEDQLPDEVFNVLDGTYIDSTTFNDLSSNPYTPKGNTIYVDTTTDITYRWSGTAYISIGSSLELGETNTTAYRGDRGKTAYDHSQIIAGNPHGTTINQVATSGATTSVKLILNGSAEVPNATTANEVVNKSQLDLKANDTDVVKLTGNQTVAGIKTFSSSPIIPDATTSLQAVNLQQLLSGSLQRTGTTILFDIPAYYGSRTTPETGNITLDSTGAIIGRIQEIYHNSASVPTITGSGITVYPRKAYQVSALNKIMLEYTEAGKVEVTYIVI